MSDKPNCWNCIHLGSVPGSAHVRCNHPSIGSAAKDPLIEMLAVLASVQRAPPIIVVGDALNIKGNPHGVANGWFNWPFNFDPTWLENCDGFEEMLEKEA